MQLEPKCIQFQPKGLRRSCSLLRIARRLWLDIQGRIKSTGRAELQKLLFYLQCFSKNGLKNMKFGQALQGR